MLLFGRDIALLIAGWLTVCDLIVLRHAWPYLYQLMPAVVWVGNNTEHTAAGCCALLLSEVSACSLTTFGRYVAKQGYVPFVSLRSKLLTGHQIVRLCRYIAQTNGRRPEQQISLCITGPVGKAAAAAIGRLLGSNTITSLSIANQYRHYPSELHGFLPALESHINATTSLANLVIAADCIRVPEWWVAVANARSLRTAEVSFRHVIDMCGVGLGHLWSGKASGLRTLTIRLGCVIRPGWVVCAPMIATICAPWLHTLVLATQMIGIGLLKAVVDALADGVHRIRVLELHLRGSTSLGKSGGLDTLRALGPLTRMYLDVRDCKLSSSVVAQVLMQLLQKVDDLTLYIGGPAVTMVPKEIMSRMVVHTSYRTVCLALGVADAVALGDLLPLTQIAPCLRMLNLSCAAPSSGICQQLPSVQPYAAGPCFVQLRVGLGETIRVGHVTIS